MSLVTVALFVLVPAAASVAGIVAGWLAYADVRPRSGPGMIDGISASHFIIFPAILATPVLLGLVLWLLSAPVADQIDQVLAVTPDLTFQRARDLLFWAAASYAFVVCMTVSSQAWVARVRMRGFIGADFPRVEPLMIVPETATVIGLVLVFYILADLRAMVNAQIAPTPAAVDAAILGLQVFAASSLVLPPATLLANQVEDLRGHGFLQALVRAEVGVFVVLAGFVWAYLQLLGLGSP